jgi:hypothetical protein
MTAPGPVWNGCARKTGGLIQCLVSSRSTRPVQVLDNSKIYAFRAALGTLLASCVRSDARRRQSRSSLSNGSDFDIAHRLESSMQGVARYRASCRWPTPYTKTKRPPVRRSYHVRRCGISLQKSPATRRGSSESSQLWPRRSASWLRHDTIWQHSRDVPYAALAGAGSPCSPAGTTEQHVEIRFDQRVVLKRDFWLGTSVRLRRGGECQLRSR